MRILLTGGGTGGHTFPLVAVARKLQDLYRGNDLKIYFIGPDNFSINVLGNEGLKTYKILGGKLRRSFSLRLPLDIVLFLLGLFQALFLVWWIMPDIVLGKGGYGSFWPVIWSKLFFVDTVVHESDTVPGFANRFLGKFADRVALAFPNAADYFNKDKVAWIGNPIRESLVEWDEGVETGREIFDLDPESGKPILLVMGGSQGAQSLNQTLARAYPKLLERYDVIHQCGQDNFEDFKEELKEVYGVDVEEKNMALVGFLNEAEYNAALNIADIVVSRAGAGSIFDVAAARKPAVLVPYPHAAGGHQRKNAFFYAREGGAVVIEEINLTPNLLIAEVNRIVQDEAKYQSMVDAAEAFSKPYAGETLAKEMYELGGYYG